MSVPVIRVGWDAALDIGVLVETMEIEYMSVAVTEIDQIVFHLRRHGIKQKFRADESNRAAPRDRHTSQTRKPWLFGRGP